MATQDRCCTIVPYYNVHPGKMEAVASASTAIGFTAGKAHELLRIADLTRLEIHGPAEELARLRGPLADLKPQFFTLEYGFRR